MFRVNNKKPSINVLSLFQVNNEDIRTRLVDTVLVYLRLNF